MELSPFVDQLRHDLAHIADTGGEDVRAAAERLLVAVEPSVRLVLLDALGAAGAEVGAQLPDAVVELRLRGREPELVVTRTEPDGPPAPPAPPPPPAPGAPPTAGADPADDGVSRLTLRLPETLKARAEDAASASGQSVNAWLVRAVAAALDQPGTPPSRTTGRRLTGWAQ
jgi:hypothetical protein